MELEHIKDVTTWDSGGDQMLDMLTLKDGRVLVVSDESVVLYPTMEEAQAGSGGDYPVIYL